MKQKRLFITGGIGFTGVHLIAAAKSQGWEVLDLLGPLEDAAGVAQQLTSFSPDAVIHLAAISAVTHGDTNAFYAVNVVGTDNLLKAIQRCEKPPSKIVLASSANVYGNSYSGLLSESTVPQPVNHYAISKLAMEHVASLYRDQLPIVITRCFNYTGIGHDDRFVIPKIIAHFKRKAATIELGDLDVEREFNDVRFVVDAYLKLLDHGVPGEAYNICTGTVVKLRSVIQMLESLSGHNPVIHVNPAFLRANEIKVLGGSSEKLQKAIGLVNTYSLRDTLVWMLTG